MIAIKDKILKATSLILVYSLLFIEIIPFVRAVENIDYSNFNKAWENSRRTLVEADVVEDNDNNPSSETEELFNSESYSATKTTQGGPGSSNVVGSTANFGGGLVNTFTGDLNYSIPLMDIEGFPIVLSYDPNISMEQEASWVGLGWNLSLGSIKRQMRGIPDDFNGDNIEHVVKRKLNYNVGSGVLFNLFGGLGNPVAFGNTGSQTNTGGDVDMKKGTFPIGLGSGVSFSRGKYFNNYSGEGRTRSFNLQATTSIGADLGVASFGGSFSGGIGLSSDTQNGRGYNSNFSLGGQNQLGPFGTQFSAYGGMQSNSRSGVRQLSYGIYKSITPGQFFSLELGGSKGSMVTFNAQSFVPTISMPTRTTGTFSTKGKNGSILYHYYYGGLGFGSSDNNSVTTLDKTSVISPAYGYYNHSEGQRHKDALLDFNRNRNIVFSSETRVLPFSAQTHDIYLCSAPGLTSTYRAHRYDVTEVHNPELTSKDLVVSYVADGDGIREKNIMTGLNALAEPTGGYSLTLQNATNIGTTTSSKGNTNLFFEGINVDETFNRSEYYLKTQGEVGLVDESLINSFGGYNASAVNMDDLGELTNLLTSRVTVNATIMGITGNFTGYTTSAFPSTNSQIKKPKTQVFYKEYTISELSVDNITGNVNWSTNIPFTESIPLGYEFNTADKLDHHVGAVEVISDNGMRYFFGIPVYNYKSSDLSFAATDRIDDTFYNQTSLVKYQLNDNTVSNSLGRAQNFEKTTVPAYSTDFLLTEMTSSDYVDRLNDGLTVDDYGNYYKLNYSNPYNGVKVGDEASGADVWKWRFPICSNQSSSEFGLEYTENLAYASKNIQSDKWDDIAHYSHGEKDVWYNTTIESKNLIAYFCLEDRDDQFSMIDENGGLDTDKPGKLLKKIKLYSKNDLEQNPATAKAIQVIEFEYNYTLCKGYVGNKFAYDYGPNSSPNNFDKTGKLTLEKIYIYNEYSNEGKGNPIVFTYASGSQNPDFAYNAQDRWGNYKPNNSALPNHIFPYSEQIESVANDNIQSWKLQSVEVIGGGKTEFNYESDRYGFVQNRRAMRMFNIAAMSSTDDLQLINGAAPDTQNGGTLPGSIINDNSVTSINSNTNCYRNPDDKRDFYNVIYFKLDKPIESANATQYIKDQYLTDESGDVVDKLYFNMLSVLDSENTQYSIEEYVESEVALGKEYIPNFCGGAGVPVNGEYLYGYLIIEAEDVKDEMIDYSESASGEVIGELDLINGDAKDDYLVNPLQIASWQFSQLNIPCSIYGEINLSASNVTEFCEYNLSNDPGVFGGNLYKKLNRKGYSLKYIPAKSFVRLYEPDNIKFGGNARISQVSVHDDWNNLSGEETAVYSTKYSYNQEASTSPTSSANYGVASYEPQVGNNENPFYEFVSVDVKRNRLPDEKVYQKDPWADPVIPAAIIGYDYVRESIFDGTYVGSTVSEFHTLKEFPTVMNRTGLAEGLRVKRSGINAVISESFSTEIFAYTQGFYVEKSDFHGKPKRTSVLDNGNNLISSSEVEYYKIDDQIKFISPTGEIISSATPRDIDIHFDNWKVTGETINSRDGITTSLGVTLKGGTIPVPYGLVKTSDDIYKYTNEMKGYTLNKVVNTYAVPKAIHTTYLGSKNIAKNKYFDLNSGQTIVSSLKDEFNDELTSMTYPSHWYYNTLGNKSLYEGAILEASEINGLNNTIEIVNSVHNITFHDGDKLNIFDGQNNIVWLLLDDAGNFNLIDETGTAVYGINWGYSGLTVEIIESAMKNILSSSMMSITTKEFPVQNFGYFTYPSNDIISASANTLVENPNLACLPLSVAGTGQASLYPDQYEPGNILNPFEEGHKGNYKFESTYVMQSDRETGSTPSIRTDAPISSYIPFYQIDNGIWYKLDDSGHPNYNSTLYKWRKLNRELKYDESGRLIESIDQIGVPSSVQYGMNNDLKFIQKANAVNAEYNEIGFDGFEDYHYFINDNINYLDYGFNLKPQNMNDLTTNIRHSGKYSLEVTGESQYSFYTSVSTNEEDAISGGQYFVKSCNCLKGFAPVTNENYLFSTWVHEETSIYPFSNTHVRFDFYDQLGTLISSSGNISPSGAVIDGWQKIEGVITIPANTHNFKIVLIGNGISYFDDFRIHPEHAGMTTIVYDQNTLLPIAEHDGYNFTTFYNYDQNLQLKRIKVETVDGIKTISESETGNLRNH